MAKIKCPVCGREIDDTCRNCKYCGFDEISSYLLNDARKKYIIQQQQEINMREERDRQINETIQQKELNKPKCPTCGSANVSKISGAKRWLSAGLFGFASSDIGKTMVCRNCGFKW